MRQGKRPTRRLRRIWEGRGEGGDILRDEKGGEGGDSSMGGEKGGEDGEVIGGKKGSVEGSAGMPPEEDIDQCRWFGSGIKGLDWAEGYNGGENEDDESKAVQSTRAQVSSTTSVIEKGRGRITPSNFGRRKHRSDLFRDRRKQPGPIH